MTYPTVTLRRGREKPVLNRHPWVFSGALVKTPDVDSGALVDLRAENGKFLARGYANPKSKLTVRLLTWDEDEVVDQAFWRRRVSLAVKRRVLDDPDSSAARLVMSEADLLPGLIADKYGPYLVVQALTAGIDRHLPFITDALNAELRPAGIFERSDDQVRDLEGLPRVSRVLTGEAPPAAGVLIKEHGHIFLVDLAEGHKTGFYLDQSRNHARVGAAASGRRVLDCFSYTGGFSVYAAKGGAQSVLSIDSSQPALARLAENLAANGLGGRAYEQRQGNAFEVLRALVNDQATFDLIILDPPKFAASGAQVDKAARAYKDVNLLACKLLAPGGLLATFSCSGHIGPELFQKIVFGAALDARRDVQVLEYLSQASDHPVLLTFPESLYLKGLYCRAI